MADGEARRRWVTMKDVAAAAGVSAITVSRVLRDPDKVKPATREKVQAAVSALGYVPDQVAGALSSRESRMVTALLSTLAGSIFASTVDGLARVLRAAGHELMLGSTEYSSTGEEALIATALGRRPDGLVLTSVDHTAAARAMLAGSGVPVVELWELPEDPIDLAVGFSNRAAGAAMTRALVERGRRRIGFIGGHSGPGHSGTGSSETGEADRRGRLRRDGYEAVLAERGLGPPRVLDRLETGPSAGAGGGVGGGPVSGAGWAGMVARGAADLDRLLARWPDTDAVFCSSDSMALGALEAARRRGLAVPADLAVVGFGDFEFAGEAGIGLTTVRIPGPEIGARAGDLILARKRGDPIETRVHDLGFEIVPRGTG